MTPSFKPRDGPLIPGNICITSIYHPQFSFEATYLQQYISLVSIFQMYLISTDCNICSTLTLSSTIDM